MFKVPGVLAVVALTLGLGACSGPSPAQKPSGGPRLRVVASFYPLAYAVAQIGGSAVEVTNLTQPGVEPHDLEVTAQGVARIADANLVVYLGGFQPAVDEAVRAASPSASLDVAHAARLETRGAGATAARDPHFWLDPLRYADVGNAIAAQLSALDPADSAAFGSRAITFLGKLQSLDGQFAAGLQSCAQPTLVTSHEAFGYLAERYGLTQYGIAGIDPQGEPDAQALAEAADLVRTRGVTTVYTETLVSPAVADAVAREAGARTAVLDPIEGVTTASAGSDYFGIMRSNLATLRRGQACA